MYYFIFINQQIIERYSGFVKISYKNFLTDHNQLA